MNGIYWSINIQVATSLAQLNTIPKIPLHRHPSCVTFHFMFIRKPQNPAILKDKFMILIQIIDWK